MRINKGINKNPKTVTYGTESVSFMAPKIWSINLYILSKKVWGNGNQAVHVGYAKPTCNMLVLYNKHVLYWNKNICYFVVYMFYNTCIFFFFYVFPHRKVDTNLETKWLADLLN